MEFGRARRGQCGTSLTFLALVVCLIIILGACTGSSTHHTAVRSTVPVPHIAHPPASPSLDAQAWTKLWRTTTGSSAHTCVTSVHGRLSARESSSLATSSPTFRLGMAPSRIRSWPTARSTRRTTPPATPVTSHCQPSPRSGLDTDSGPIMPVQGINPAWAGNGMFFYASGTVLPERGRWRLTAQLGQNSGCFDVTF